MTDIFDRVMEVTTTEGFDNITLEGAVTGYQTFAAACGGAAEVRVCIVGAPDGPAAAQWEVVSGVFTAPNSFERGTVESSSAGGDPVDFVAGTKHVYVVQSAAMVKRLLVLEGGAPTLEGGAAIAVGNSASATATEAIAIGGFTVADADNTLAIGFGATASGSYGIGGVAVGKSTIANAGVSIGHNARCGSSSVAIGTWDTPNASGDSAVAIGYRAKASDSESVVVGSQALSTAGYAVALGATAHGNELYGIAIGYGAVSNKPGATAIGPGCYAELIPGSYSRGVRYNLTEDAVFLEGTTNAGTTSANLAALGYAGEEMEPYYNFGLLYGYVYANGVGDSDGEAKIIRIEAAFRKSGGTVSILGTPTYTEIYESAGATGWSVAVSGSSGILRVTVTNDATNGQYWKAKLWLESF